MYLWRRVSTVLICIAVSALFFVTEVNGKDIERLKRAGENEEAPQLTTDPEYRPYCPQIELLRGRDGRDGLPGVPGRDGDKGEPGPPGPQGLTGPTTTAGGAVYVRWGKADCPDVSGTELVYGGIAAGTDHRKVGGSSTHLCLPKVPRYSTYRTGVQGESLVYGTEYQTWVNSIFPSNVHDHNVPCAICFVSNRSTVFSFPAMNECPSSWTLEYSGYLMSATHRLSGHYRTSFECVDEAAEGIPGSSANTDGAQFHFVEASCNGVPCPPYDSAKELTCAVCTR